MLGRVHDGWWIPATATWTEVRGADLPSLFDGLREAATTIGGVQIQNRGTVVGNVANASPAADGVPSLMALDAAVELASLRGRRRVPVGEFVTGNRATLRAPDELVTGIHVPDVVGDGRGGFEKLGARTSLVISIAMVAGVLVRSDDARIADARIAVGACSPVARRLPDLEARLRGQPWSAGAATQPVAADLAPLTPIDDIRGTADYRFDAALTLVRRLLGRLLA
jgi:CO/xanthine dehydrogenase FAD-binding subunit